MELVPEVVSLLKVVKKAVRTGLGGRTEDCQEEILVGWEGFQFLFLFFNCVCSMCVMTMLTCVCGAGGDYFVHIESHLSMCRNIQECP